MNRASMRSPLISVLMPVYNCQAHVEAAIESVRGQAVEDWELIVVDDGSSDGTPAVLAELAAREPRMRVVRQENAGVGAALNVALALARGKYLARLDADDLAPAGRFAEQVEFLDDHGEITVVGGWFRTVGGSASGRVVELPTEPGHVKAALIFRNSLHHSSLMMRHQAFADNGWRYVPRRRFPEDYDLFVTIAEKHELANIPKVLLEYRIWPGSVQHDPQLDWREDIIDAQCRMLARMGLKPDVRQREIHAALAFDEIRAEREFIAKAHEWLLLIDRHNQSHPALESAGLARTLTGRYIALYRAAARAELDIDGLADSPFRRFVQVPL